MGRCNTQLEVYLAEFRGQIHTLDSFCQSPEKELEQYILLAMLSRSPCWMLIDHRDWRRFHFFGNRVYQELGNLEARPVGPALVAHSLYRGQEKRMTHKPEV